MQCSRIPPSGSLLRAEKSYLLQAFIKKMFASREQAGELLGEALKKLSLSNGVVLGITRGGVVVAAEVARILKWPLYPLVVKKVSSPFNPEFAVGAVGPENVTVGEWSQEAADQVAQKMQVYGMGNLDKVIKGKTAIIVDDGIATGWTLRAAIKYARRCKAGKVVAAVPVADREIAKELRKEVDELVVLDEADELGAVGNFYEEFPSVSDGKVVMILERAVDSFSQR